MPEMGEETMSKTDEEIEFERPAEDAPETEWKKFSRMWEQRAKSGPSPEEVQRLRERAERADELEAATQTDVERLTARVEDAERRAQEAEGKLAEIAAEGERRALLDEVAAAKGVPASALRGSTKEDLEAHADEILALIPEKSRAASDGTGGDRGADIEGEDASAQDIAASIRI